MNFLPYPRYKNSGVEWLGDVPEHWDLKKFGFLLERGYDGMKIGPFGSQLKSEMLVEQGFKVYGQENVINNDFTIGQRFVDEPKFDELRVYEVKTGDLLITMMGSSGYCQIVPAEFAQGIMDSHLIRLRTRPAVVRRRFVRLLIDEGPYVKHQMLLSGKGSIMHGLNSSIISNLFFLLPSIQEQELILHFLIRETAKVDTLIAKQERLIELLREKRQSIIARAVTKGLDPHKPMKDSGTEWLGDTPAHWKVSKLKYSLVSIEQGWSPECENRPANENEWGVLKIGCVNGIDFDPNENKTLPAGVAPVNQYALKKGDVLLSRGNTRELVGSAALVVQDYPKLLLCDLLYRLRFDQRKCLPDFAALFLRTSIIRKRIEIEATGSSSTMQKITQGTIKNFPLALPPVDEQQAIVESLKRQTAKLELLVKKVQEQIILSKEHRAALISAAVTGKIDVRQYAI